MQQTSSNSVVAFMGDAELQAETDEQRQAVFAALDDTLNLSVAELRQMRYPDYQGYPNTRNVVQVLTDHFVPSSPASLDPGLFYQDISTSEGRAAIQMQLDRLQPGHALSPLPDEVDAFIERRDTCDHFRGEDPYDAERLAYINRMIQENCRGTDRALADLRKKYADSPAIMGELSIYEDHIEPPAQ